MMTSLGMKEIDYPYHIESKDELYRIVKDTPENLLKGRAYKDVYGSHMTDWNRIQKHEIVSKFVRWIEDEMDARMVSIWGVLYGENGGIKEHNHKGSTWSFVYYINVPKNSSNLCFPDLYADIDFSVPAREGKVVIFESFMRHYVPKNDCKGRCVISGNLMSKTV